MNQNQNTLHIKNASKSNTNSQLQSEFSPRIWTILGTFIQKYISEKYKYFYPVMCASLRPFQNCLQIDSSVNIKAVMMILVHIYALLWPYIRFVTKKKKVNKM